MTKSQLRKLAVDYAEGLLPAGEYHARRRKLIDAIVEGTLPIERDAPALGMTRDTAAATGKAGPKAPPPHRQGRLPSNLPSNLPWHLILGGASALCILALMVLLLWPAGEPATPTISSVPVQGLPRARTLVESFLARRDFDAGAIAAFEEQWLAMNAGERDEARSALWFSGLVRALRDEVKTQKALAGLASGGDALDRARRVIALAGTLGVADQLPDMDDVQSTPPADPAPASPIVTGTATAPAPAASADSAPAAAAEPDLPTAPSRPPTGREWLAMQSDAALTLQLFAVNQLDRVEQLMAAHPVLPVRILATDGASPRYRIFHGVFVDETSAIEAFNALPADITAAAGGAIVKSFGAVREDLARRSAAPATAPAPVKTPAPVPGTPEASSYTLQLFASASRSNAESLMQAFPGLFLELRELSGNAAPYRVVHGNFNSVDSARAAGRLLPDTLRAKVGEPLVKPVAETGRPIQP